MSFIAAPAFSKWQHTSLVSDRYIKGIDAEKNAICIYDILQKKTICSIARRSMIYLYFSFFNGIFYINAESNIIASSVDNVTYLKRIISLEDQEGNIMITHAIPQGGLSYGDAYIHIDNAKSPRYSAYSDKISIYSAQENLCKTGEYDLYNNAARWINGPYVLNDFIIENILTREHLYPAPVNGGFYNIVNGKTDERRVWCDRNKSLYYIDTSENTHKLKVMRLALANRAYSEDILYDCADCSSEIKKIKISPDERYILLSYPGRQVILYTYKDTIIFESRLCKIDFTASAEYFLLRLEPGRVILKNSPLSDTPKIMQEIKKHFCGDLANIIKEYAALYDL